MNDGDFVAAETAQEALDQLGFFATKSLAADPINHSKIVTYE